MSTILQELIFLETIGKEMTGETQRKNIQDLKYFMVQEVFQ